MVFENLSVQRQAFVDNVALVLKPDGSLIWSAREQGTASSSGLKGGLSSAQGGPGRPG